MVTNLSPPSIFTAPPIEIGGTVNRIGIAFQDAVAACYSLDLLLDSCLLEVWCESQDDITLIREESGKKVIECIQVKTTDVGTWSVAELCKQDKIKGGAKKPGTSIVEKSLQFDQFAEPITFRIVTSHPVNQDLKILLQPFDSQERKTSDEVQKLADKLIAKVKNYLSGNKNDASFWAQNAKWEVKSSESDIENEAIVKMLSILQQRGDTLLIDHLKDIFKRLRWYVFDAACAEYRVYPQKKRITKEALKAWFDSAVNSFLFSSSAKGGDVLKDKLEKASLNDYFSTADDQRRQYLTERYRAQYLEVRDRKLLENETAALLNLLKSRLDCGVIPDVGIDFHKLCLEELEALRNTLPIQGIKPPQHLLQGCMYNIADRCDHRFRRAVS